MLKKKINGQIINQIKIELLKIERIHIKKFDENDNPNKLKVNLSEKLKKIIRKNIKIDIIKNNLYHKIIQNNLKKYNSSSQTNNILAINNLIKCKGCHFLAIFKDHLIADYIEEFMRRFYMKRESIDRMAKIYEYYKNYLKYFCRPTFKANFANQIIKSYKDMKAEYFFKNNLSKNKSEKDKKILDNKIISDEYNNNMNYEFNLEKKDKPFGKSLFTKSIKYSIDNINMDDFSLSEKKIKKLSQFDSESIVKHFGSDEEDTNLLLNNNSTLLIINEIKDVKERKYNNNKPKIKEKTIRINSNNNNINKKRFFSIETSKNDNSNITKTRNINNNKNNFNLEKINTCTNNLHNESFKNMIYSPKSNKKCVFFHKKDIINKTEGYLSQKSDKVDIKKMCEKPNSIILNINININTNQEIMKSKANISNNLLHFKNNLVYKSPSNQIYKSKNIFSFSPTTSRDSFVYKNDRPLLTSRNEEISKTGYIKILQRKKDNNQMILKTDRNEKYNEKKNMRILNSLESFDIFQKNYNSRNKVNLLYNKHISSRTNQNKDYKIEINTKELYYCNNKTINNKLYFSPNKLGKKRIIKNRNMEANNNKNFVYHKKTNNIISSSLNKKEILNKKVKYS